MSEELTAKQRLQAIYAQIPKLQCERKCQECCGPIMMSKLEWDCIIERVGHEPKGTPNLDCPMLQNGACSVYDIRPGICRLWGVVKAMACPFGCEPERWLTDPEARKILAQLEVVSLEVTGL